MGLWQLRFLLLGQEIAHRLEKELQEAQKQAGMWER